MDFILIQIFGTAVKDMRLFEAYMRYFVIDSAFAEQLNMRRKIIHPHNHFLVV